MHSTTAAPGDELAGVRRDTALRGSLTVWFTAEAIAAWRAEPRITCGGQPHFSDLAIATALTLRAVSPGAAANRRSDPLHSTAARPRSGRPRPQHDEPAGEVARTAADAGEWLVEQRGTRTRRLWRKLHLDTDADTGEIVTAKLTGHDVDDGGQVEALLDGYGGLIAPFTADSA